MVRDGDHAGTRPRHGLTPRTSEGGRRGDARARSEGWRSTLTLWYLIIRALLLWMALTGTTLQRLPLTTALMYLGVGWVLGGRALGLLAVDPITDKPRHDILAISGNLSRLDLQRGVQI